MILTEYPFIKPDPVSDRLKRLHVVVSGRVQGVWFRAATREHAQRLGLVVKVWNRSDGRVEVIAEGSEEILSQFLEWCRVGPRGARVENIESDWSIFTDEFGAFDIV